MRVVDKVGLLLEVHVGVWRRVVVLGVGGVLRHHVVMRLRSIRGHDGIHHDGFLGAQGVGSVEEVLIHGGILEVGLSGVGHLLRVGQRVLVLVVMGLKVVAMVLGCCRLDAGG